MTQHTLTETPNYYSAEYDYRRYPARVNGYPGAFNVWSDEVVAKTYAHGQRQAKVTWSPETVCLVAKEYQNEAWHAERAERAARPDVSVGDEVRLGDLVITVAKRCAEYVDGVPCLVIEEVVV